MINQKLELQLLKYRQDYDLQRIQIQIEMQDCSDASCQLNVLKLENVSLQGQIQNMKMILEEKFNDEQKDELKRTMVTDLTKLRTQKELGRFINKMKSQLEQVMDDYLGLKEFSQQKSNQIVQLQQQLEKQDKVISILKQYGVKDVSELMENHEQIKKQNEQMQQQINQQIVIVDGLNQKNADLQQSNQQLNQYIQHCQDQLHTELKTSKQEKKKDVREIMDITVLEDQQQKEQGLKDYLQKNTVIVQEVEQDIEEEKKKEEARQLAIKKAEAKTKRGRYGHLARNNNQRNNNNQKNNQKSANTKSQKRPLSQKVNKQTDIIKIGQNGFDKNQFNTFQESAKHLNKQNSQTNQDLIKSTIYNKKRENSRSNSRNNSRVAKNSQKQIDKKNLIKEFNISKKEDQNGQSQTQNQNQSNTLANSANDLLNNNILNNNYMSQPVKIEKVESNSGQNLDVIKKHMRSIVGQISRSKMQHIKSFVSPPRIVAYLHSNLVSLLYGEPDAPYSTSKKYMASVGFIKKMTDYDPDSLTEDQYKQLDNMMKNEQVTLDKVVQVSSSHAEIYRWLQEAYCYYKIKNKV